MRKVGFIVETDMGESLAYHFLVFPVAGKNLSDMEVWGLGILRGYDYVPKGSRAIRFEWESEEEV